MDNVFEYLQKLGIHYENFAHPAVFTVEEARKYRINADFGETKNLFLRNRKGDRHYLVSAPADKKIDLEKFEKMVNEKDIGLASPERMKTYLGLTPGSVSPFGLLNDLKHEVIFVMDDELLKFERLGFHPNINTATTIISRDDFKIFAHSVGNKILHMDL